jgi:hypothetical protein
MWFMLRAREAGTSRHRLVGKDRLVTKWLHAIIIDDQAGAEEYARWLIKENAGSQGIDSVQVIDAHRRGAKPVTVIAADTGSPDALPRR